LPEGSARDDRARALGELPNLRHLRLFDAAVRLGSLAAGADAVHLTQPAASQAMGRLAQVYGAPLLHRSGNGSDLTAAGRIVHIRTQRLLAHLAEGDRRAAIRTRAGAPDVLTRQASTAQLRALATFAETGSFSAAARRQGLTEPAVQRAARGIETAMGVPLFEGQTHALRLTPAGEAVAAQAGLALRELSKARDELREGRGLYDGTLVIATLPLVRTRIVPDAIVALMARHPQARIKVIDGPYETLLRMLRSGACDLLVGALREGAQPGWLREVRLFDDRLAVVARAGHPLAGHPLCPSDLARYPWVLPRRETPGRAVFDRLVAEHGVADPARGHVETGSLVALRGVLLASDAVTLMSPLQVDYELRQGLLVALAMDLPDSLRPIGFSVLADWQPTALMAEFVDCLRDACPR
jgi:LysR family transcriptional regulator, regulator for genes of the gallate degradation pathway